MNLKSFLSSKLSPFTKKRLPWLHKILVFVYLFPLLYLKPAFKYFLGFFSTSSSLYQTNFFGLQSVSLIRVPFPLDSPSSLGLFFNTENSTSTSIAHGGWSSYLYPLPLTSCSFDPVVLSDSSPKGLKVIFPKPGCPTDSYGNAGLGQYFTVFEKLRVANLLSSLNLCPKVYDLILLEDPHGIQRYAYILEHVDISELHASDLNDFKSALLDTPLISTFSFDSPDFSLDPKKNHFTFNRRTNTINTLDFQTFSYQDEALSFVQSLSHLPPSLFGPKRIGSSELYLYQSIPGIADGKRDTSRRFDYLDQLFADASVSLLDTSVLDVGCNIGLNMYYALSRSANFVTGLDLPEIIQSSDLVLSSLGCTRFNLHSLDLKNISELKPLLETLTYDTLFYFSISAHIGFPNHFLHNDLKYIVYEGHPNSTVESSLQALGQNGFPTKLLSSCTIIDGDSGRRNLLLIQCF